MARVMMICNTDGALYVFRGPIIRRLVSRGYRVATLSGASSYITRLRELGVDSQTIDFPRNSSSLASNLRLLRHMLVAIERFRPDVVHNFTHKPAVFGTFAARFAGVRHIFVTVTGLGTVFVRDDLRSRVLRWMLVIQYWLAMKFVTRVFFQNPDDMRVFLSLGLVRRSRAVLTGGSGIDLEKFRVPSIDAVTYARTQLGLELSVNEMSKLIILLPSRAVREKGVVEFYRAARECNNQRPGAYLFIHAGLIDSESGGGIPLATMTALAEECGVHYVGFREDIEGLMAAADVVVLPSYREGIPRSLLEALALGKFIITTDAPGCREVVRDGWNGLLCKPKDVRSLANAILAVKREDLLVAASRSRAYAEERFDADLVVSATLSSYEESLGVT